MNRHLRLVPGNRAFVCGRRPRPETLLVVSRARVLERARELGEILAATPGLLELLVAGDPQVRAALLPLLDAVEEYEGRAADAPRHRHP